MVGAHGANKWWKKFKKQKQNSKTIPYHRNSLQKSMHLWWWFPSLRAYLRAAPDLSFFSWSLTTCSWRISTVSSPSFLVSSMSFLRSNTCHKMNNYCVLKRFLLYFEFIVGVDQGLDFFDKDLFIMLRWFISDWNDWKSLSNNSGLEINFVSNDLRHELYLFVMVNIL